MVFIIVKLARQVIVLIVDSSLAGSWATSNSLSLRLGTFLEGLPVRSNTAYSRGLCALAAENNRNQ